jgi:two-component system sensor histidine kinase and response regulator WspE
MTDAPDPVAELFQAEVAAAAAALADGLAVLAADPGSKSPLDALDRAAKRAKAAAVIVGRADVADAARALEAAFSQARAGGLTAGRVAELQELSSGLVGRVESAKPELPAEGAVSGFADSTRPTPDAPAPPPADPSLLELFREEVTALTGSLAAGLVALEANPTDPRLVEPLMRAAHSLKGAARIVAVEPGVQVAHVMEELLVAAQRGDRPVTPDDTDALLAATDLLAGMAGADLAAWAQANAGRAADTASALNALLRGEKPVRKPRPEAPPLPPPAAPPPAAPPPAEPVVRVTAQSLTRLLSLAGESLVEARWLQPFAKSLLNLKKQQDHLAAVLDELPGADDARRRLLRCRQELAGRIDSFEAHAQRSDDLNSRLYREVIASRMRPFADGTHGLPRMARDVARQLGKQVSLTVRGQDVDVDRDILDRLDAPLGHLVRNALDHAIEAPAERAAAGKPAAGTLVVEARHHAGMLTVRVSDDGRGIDLARLRDKVVEKGLTTAELAARLSEPELLDFLFLPGFSTKGEVTDVSGRGVGLDVVHGMATAVGGSVRVTTKLGAGTTFELHLPITLSVVRAVLVTVAGDPFALPLTRTDRLLRIPQAAVSTLEGKPHIDVGGRPVGLVPAHLLFDLTPEPPPADPLAVVLVGDRTHQYGLIVDGLLGEQDLVVRPLDPRLGKVPTVSACSLLEDGTPVLIADVDDLARLAVQLAADGKLRHRRPDPTSRKAKRVLVVDDSAIVREAERQLLVGRGYAVDVAVDGMDGWQAARRGAYDLVVSDIDMPRMTGLELVRAIRADPATRGLPVVVVSYKDRAEDRDRGRDAGADAYLTKSSFHDGRFLATVAELIGEPDA